MQVPAPFDYERATSVDHAIGLLARLGPTARLVAGGHSLLPMMKLRLAHFEYLIDINDLHRDLGYIRVEPTQIRIGRMTRHRELLEHARCARCARSSTTPSGSSPIRSCATGARSAARCARPTRRRTCRRCAPPSTPPA
jgi:CO/xanthine dehydrogenase FAD-binding subunit